MRHLGDRVVTAGDFVRVRERLSVTTSSPTDILAARRSSRPAGRRSALASAAHALPRPSRSRRLPALLLATVALLLPAVALAGPTAAAPPGVAGPGAAVPVQAGAPVPEGATAAAHPPSAAAPHCVLAAGDGQAPRCFATFPAAISAATGGRVDTAPASPAAAVHDPAFTAAVEAEPATLGSVLVGIEYADLNYGGSSLSMIAGGRCDYSLDVDYRFPSLPSGWNDRISSFRSYSNCAQQLFRWTSYSGALTNIVTAMSYVGST